jgi:uncharacterized RDD family membrane protein YckC
VKSVRIAAFPQPGVGHRLSTSYRYAPPRGDVRDFEVYDEMELAGRGARLGAFFLDGLVAALMIYVPAVIVLAVAGRLDSALDPTAATIDVELFAIAGVMCLSGFIAWAWITALLVARNGQTIGKRMVDIKVVRSDGSPASLGRVFWLRNVVNGLLGVIPLYGIVDLLCIFGVRRQCIHDLIADTIVIQA